MLNIHNLSYSFPNKELYNTISFSLEHGHHCAFIGTSGSGKSTLIEMIKDTERYLYDGKIEIDPACRLGFVSQFSQLDTTEKTTVYDYIAAPFLRLQQTLFDLCKEMETASDATSLMDDYQLTLDAFDAIDGNDFESNIQIKLNLAHLMSHKNQLVSDLSGGEFKLIQVIKEMLMCPDLMIMDEPDVFLDFNNLNALKRLINSHKGILLIITHSRYLLNHCFNKIIHLENKELQEFEGRYIDYTFSLLQQKIELQELAIADTLEIERNAQIIDRLRFIATNNAEAARGKSLNARVKIQERLESRRIKAPFVEIRQPKICFEYSTQTEDSIAVKVNNYSVSFDELILEEVSFEINAHEKVAIIGSNGTGKTTLLREIYKNNHPTISIHESIRMAYLSQLQGEILNESNTLFDEFFDIGFKTYQDITDYLGNYGFSEIVLNQKIASLSGGEKNILQIAKISAFKANFLLLDEPTSHLDTYAQLALEKAISEFAGGILMISHDFYSIVNCMDYVLIIEDKTIRKIRMRKFRKMIYESHFDKDYLELEQKKKSFETKIELALKDSDFEKAKLYSIELEQVLKLI